MSYFVPKNNLDMFGKLRVSQPQTLFDSKLLRDADTYQWDDVTVSGTAASAYNANQSSVTLSTTAAIGRRVRQTKRRFNYQPGKAQAILITGILAVAGGVANSYTLLGPCDDKNGLYFRRNSTGVYVGRRTYTSGSAVDTEVLQSSWNIDKLDGTGVSGKTLDTSKTLIYSIEFEWLGVGSIRYGVIIDGLPCPCHQINNSNILTMVYMTTPNLPVRWEVNSTSAATNSCTAICCTVITEGGLQETGKMVAVDRGVTALTTGNDTNIYPLLAVRLLSTALDTVTVLQSISIAGGSVTSFKWQILLNPTVAGTAFSWAAVTGSGMEAATGTTSATTLTAGTGVALMSGYGVAGQEGSFLTSISPSSLQLIGSTVAGVSDILVLAIQRITGAAETFYAAMQFREL